MNHCFFCNKKLSTTCVLAVRFSLVLSVVILTVAFILTWLLRYSIRLRQNEELVSSMNRIASVELKIHVHRFALDLEHHSSMFHFEMDNYPPRRDGTRIAPPPAGANLPYYITFTVFDQATETVFETNDPFLPLLPVSNGHPKRYTKKNFFIDGDLNLLYCSRVFTTEQGEQFVVQSALSMDRDTAEQLLDRSLPVFLIILIPLLFISYIAAYLISKSTMVPVHTMTAAARRIGSANLDQCLPTTGRGDELDELAYTFNDLFARLKTDFDRERQFTSDVSHELRTPIAVILGHANLIRRWGKDDPEQLQKSLGMLISEVHSMESIVENLLQLSRLENGTWNLSMQEVSLVALCRRLQADTLAWAPQVRFDIDAQELSLRTDQELLYQACTIVVSNSVKFGGEAVHISVSVQHEDDVIELRFADSGPGIAPEILPHVFERFYRGDPAHNRAKGGSGLGLAIVKSILTVLGGSVKAEPSESGAVFVFTVPCDNQL